MKRFLILTLFLVVSGHAAWADHEETERRLKSVGIDQEPDRPPWR